MAFWSALAYNASFFPCICRTKSALERRTQRRASLAEHHGAIAVVALFVDLVVRFDQIAKSWQVPRVAGVGLCVTGMIFKWFVLYLHLSYLVD